MPLAEHWTSLLDKNHLSHRRLEGGETVFRQGDQAAGVYIVEAGRIRLVRHLEDGTTVPLHVAAPGDSFAEASLWAEAYHCDAVAEIPSVVIAIPKIALLAALTADASAALSLARGLATQVRVLRSRLELRNLRSARQRVESWLRLHASGSPPSLRLDRHWTSVAEELGLTHEALYRTLATLQAEGRIQRQQKFVVLLRSGDSG